MYSPIRSRGTQPSSITCSERRSSGRRRGSGSRRGEAPRAARPRWPRVSAVSTAAAQGRTRLRRRLRHGLPQRARVAALDLHQQDGFGAARPSPISVRRTSSRKVRSSSSTAEGSQREQRGDHLHQVVQRSELARGAPARCAGSGSSRHSIAVTNPSVPSAPMMRSSRSPRREPGVERVARGVLPGPREASGDEPAAPRAMAGATSASKRRTVCRPVRAARRASPELQHFAVRPSPARAPSHPAAHAAVAHRAGARGIGGDHAAERRPTGRWMDRAAAGGRAGRPRR